MSDVTKPIMLDETGQAIVNALMQNDIVAQKTAEISTAANAIKDEVINSIPEDYTNMSADVEMLKSYVTPEMFGCIGDGVTDDLTNFKAALSYAITHDLPLHLEKKYYLSSYIDMTEYTNPNIEIVGSVSSRKRVQWPYNTNAGNRSVVICPNGFMKSGSLYGRIANIIFCGDIDSTAWFDGSALHLMFTEVSLYNLKFAFKNCTHNMTRIEKMKALSVRNFNYFGTFVDSSITDSYINGGDYNADGIFMSLHDANGCSINDSFIDYYKIMYDHDGTNSTTLCIVSNNNKYQVFRYFDKLNSGAFTSSNDEFAYCDEQWCRNMGYLADTVIDKYTNESVEVKPYIFAPKTNARKLFTNACMLRNYDNVVFVNDYNLYELKNALAHCEFICKDTVVTPGQQILSAKFPTGNAGTGNLFKPNVYKVNLIRDVDSVTDTYSGSTAYYPYVIGEIVRYTDSDNISNLYEVVPYYYDSGSGIRPGGIRFKQITAMPVST